MRKSFLRRDQGDFKVDMCERIEEIIRNFESRKAEIKLNPLEYSDTADRCVCHLRKLSVELDEVNLPKDARKLGQFKKELSSLLEQIEAEFQNQDFQWNSINIINRTMLPAIEKACDIVYQASLC